MPGGVQQREPDPAQRLAEGGAVAQVDPDRHGVEEQADLVLPGVLEAVGHRRAEDQVPALLRREQQRDGRCHGHVQRGALAGRERAQCRRRAGRDLHPEQVPRRGVGGGRGAWRQAGQPAAPVPGQLGSRRTGQQLPFGPRVVHPGRGGGVGGRQRARVRAGQRETAQQYRDTGPVGDQVMDRQQQVRPVRGALHQQGADQRRPGEVEGPGEELGPDVLSGEVGDRSLQAAQVGALQGEGQAGGVDVLERLGSAVVDGGAQRGVVVDERAQRGGQRLRRHRSGQLQLQRHGVGHTRGVLEVQRPEPFLGVRERSALLPAGPDRGPAGLSGGPGGVHGDGEPGHARRGEDRAHRQLGAEPGADPAGEPDRGQAVAAELEEVVQPADPAHPQHLGEERGEQLLGAGAWFGPGRGLLGGAARRVEQGAAVHLAGRSQRQPLQRDDPAGDQMGGHPPGQPVAQFGGQPLGGGRVARLGGIGGHHPGDQVLVAAGQRPHGDHRVRGTRVGGQGALQLARLDPEPAQFDLAVGAPQELQGAVRPPARPVPGPVEPAARLRAERIGGEAGRRAGRVAQVAEGHAVAAGPQLADRAARHQAAVRVHQIDRAALHRAADRHRIGDLLGRAHHLTGREGGVLGGAVAVDHRALDHLQRGPHLTRRQHVAAGQQPAQRAQALRVLLGHRVEEPGGEPERGGPRALDQRAEPVQVRHPGRADQQYAAVQQRRPQLQGGGVEFGGREGEPALVLGHLGEPSAAHQPDDGPVRDGHALGDAGRAGGEHHVRRVLAAGRDPRGRPAGVVRPLRQRDHQDAGSQLSRGLAGGAVQDGGQARLLDQQRRPLRGLGEVQRDVGRPALEDREQRDDVAHRAAAREADEVPAADATGGQLGRARVGPAVELAVGERVRVRRRVGRPGRGEGRGVPAPGSYLAEEFGQPDRGRVGGRRRGAEQQEFAALGGVEQFQRADRGARGAGRRVGEPDQVLGHPAGGGVREQVPVVLQMAHRAAVRALGQLQGQVELGAAPVDPLHGDVQPGQPQLLAVAGEQAAGHVEERVAAGRPGRADLLDQPVERHPGVVEPGEQGAPGPLGGGGVRGVARQVDPQRLEVGEQPCALPPPGAGPARHRYPDGEVLLAGPAVQHGGEGREQGGEDRAGRPVGPRRGDRTQRAQQLGRQLHREQRAAPTGGGRPGPVGGQFERRQLRRLLLPVRQRARRLRAGQPGAVLQGVGAVRCGRRQLGRLAAAAGAVQFAQVAQQTAHRPAVRDDVMERQDQPMAGRGEAQQPAAQQGAGRQVEGALRLQAGDPVGRLRLPPVLGQFVHRQGQLDPGRHPLQGGAVAHGEGGAQRFVALRQIVQCGGQLGCVERTLQADRSADVVGGAAGGGLLGEPDPPLLGAERQHDGAGPGGRAAQGGQARAHQAPLLLGGERGRAARRRLGGGGRGRVGGGG